MVITKDIQILIYLIEHPKQHSIRAIAKALNINYRTAYDNIKALKQLNLIKTQELKNTTLCQINHIYHEKTVQAQILRRKEKQKDKDIRLICHEIEKINNPFFIALLFGSRTKSKKGSDIDICIIADDDKIAYEIDIYCERYKIEGHVIDFTPEQFIDMLTTTRFNVGQEIEKNNIILHGIENYYEILQRKPETAASRLAKSHTRRSHKKNKV